MHGRFDTKKTKMCTRTFVQKQKTYDGDSVSAFPVRLFLQSCDIIHRMLVFVKYPVLKGTSLKGYIYYKASLIIRVRPFPPVV